MANKAEKWKDNAAGKFFVDQQCIDCDLCRETAPAFFMRHDDGGYSFVHKQPTTEEEVARVALFLVLGSFRRQWSCRAV